MNDNEATYVVGELLETMQPTVTYTIEPVNEDGTYKPVAPLQGTLGSAGFDLAAAQEIIIGPRGSVLVRTGIKCAIPIGWCGIINPRSSMASKTPLRIGARVIDSDYRGEVLINIHNDSNLSPWKIEQGERIAQIVFMQHLSTMECVESLDDTDRGDGGFGSTGK